ncbi:hypothetical protein JCM3775_003969 [Rhodotorula graminis]
MQPNLSGATVISPRRLPDELIFIIIEWCAYLEGDRERERTFAALCLLSRHYKPAAERHLCSRVTITGKVHAQGIFVSSAAQVVARRPELRQHVQSVAYGMIESPYVEEHLSIAALLVLLPNVEELVEPDWYSPALACMLASARVRIRRLFMDTWQDSDALPLENYPPVFSALRHLRIQHLDNWDWFTLPPVLRRLTTLAFGRSVNGLNIIYRDPEDEAFLPPNLDTLSFPLDLVHDSSSALADCQRLRHFAIVGEASVAKYRTAIGQLAALLYATPPTVLSISIDATLRIYTGDGKGNERVVADQEVLPILIPPSSTDLLAAIPQQVEHLSLVTNCFRAVDVAIYLLSTSRPRALKRLRVGGDVGRGLGWILYGGGAEGTRYAGLKTQLERDGVIVTTVPSYW